MNTTLFELTCLTDLPYLSSTRLTSSSREAELELHAIQFIYSFAPNYLIALYYAPFQTIKYP